MPYNYSVSGLDPAELVTIYKDAGGGLLGDRVAVTLADNTGSCLLILPSDSYIAVAGSTNAPLLAGSTPTEAEVRIAAAATEHTDRINAEAAISAATAAAAATEHGYRINAEAAISAAAATEHTARLDAEDTITAAVVTEYNNRINAIADLDHNGVGQNIGWFPITKGNTFAAYGGTALCTKIGCTVTVTALLHAPAAGVYSVPLTLVTVPAGYRPIGGSLWGIACVEDWASGVWIKAANLDVSTGAIVMESPGVSAGNAFNVTFTVTYACLW